MGDRHGLVARPWPKPPTRVRFLAAKFDGCSSPARSLCWMSETYLQIAYAILKHANGVLFGCLIERGSDFEKMEARSRKRSRHDVPNLIMLMLRFSTGIPSTLDIHQVYEPATRCAVQMNPIASHREDEVVKISESTLKWMFNSHDDISSSSMGLSMDKVSSL